LFCVLSILLSVAVYLIFNISYYIVVSISQQEKDVLYEQPRFFKTLLIKKLIHAEQVLIDIY